MNEGAALVQLDHLIQHKHCAAFWVWFLSRNVRFSRFIHVVARISTSSLFMDGWCSIVWVDHISCILHQLMNIWVVMKNAAMNVRVQGFEWMQVSISLACTPRSRIAGSYGSSV